MTKRYFWAIDHGELDIVMEVTFGSGDVAWYTMGTDVPTSPKNFTVIEEITPPPCSKDPP